jgi:hypothetical protein
LIPIAKFCAALRALDSKLTIVKFVLPSFDAQVSALRSVLRASASLRNQRVVFICRRPTVRVVAGRDEHRFV